MILDIRYMLLILSEEVHEKCHVRFEVSLELFERVEELSYQHMTVR